jgi:hypothetical protein
LLHMFWTSPFNASLSFFALALVIGPIGTSNGSLTWLRLVLGWSASLCLHKQHRSIDRFFNNRHSTIRNKKTYSYFFLFCNDKIRRC